MDTGSTFGANLDYNNLYGGRGAAMFQGASSYGFPEYSGMAGSLSPSTYASPAFGSSATSTAAPGGPDTLTQIGMLLDAGGRIAAAVRGQPAPMGGPLDTYLQQQESAKADARLKEILGTFSNSSGATGSTSEGTTINSFSGGAEEEEDEETEAEKDADRVEELIDLYTLKPGDFRIAGQIFEPRKPVFSLEQ